MYLESLGGVILRPEMAEGNRSGRHKYVIVQTVASSKAVSCCWEYAITLGLQIPQSRSYVHTLGPKVGTIYVLGALG